MSYNKNTSGHPSVVFGTVVTEPSKDESETTMLNPTDDCTIELRKTLKKLCLLHVEHIFCNVLGGCTTDDLLQLDPKMMSTLQLKPLELKRFEDWKCDQIHERHTMSSVPTKDDQDSKPYRRSSHESTFFEKPKDHFCLCTVGDSAVGKTSIIDCYVNGEQEFAEDEHKATVGCDVQFKDCYLDVETERALKLNVQINDTGGAERFRSLTKNYYRRAHGIMLVYDVCSRKSFKSIEQWMEEIRRYGLEGNICVLVGNKIDKKEEREISKKEGETLARAYQLPYFETSAKTQEGVEDVFVQLCIEMSKRFTLEQPKKGRFQISDQEETKQSKKWKCCTIL